MYTSLAFLFLLSALQQPDFEDVTRFSIRIQTTEFSAQTGVHDTCMLVKEDHSIHIEKAYSGITGGMQSRVFEGALDDQTFSQLRSILDAEAFKNLNLPPKPAHISRDTMYLVSLNEKGRHQTFTFEEMLENKQNREAMKPLQKWIKETLKKKFPELKKITGNQCMPQWLGTKTQ